VTDERLAKVWGFVKYGSISDELMKVDGRTLSCARSLSSLHGRALRWKIWGACLPISHGRKTASGSTKLPCLYAAISVFWRRGVPATVLSYASTAVFGPKYRIEMYYRRFRQSDG
jgi:hypothetical protein